jgi:peptidyl-prolyl cis-trans isomerase SurA
LRLSVAAFVAASFLGLAAPVFAAGRVVERVVAVVNDEIILDSELEQYAAPNLKNPLDLDTPEGQKAFDEIKHKHLNELIDDRLIEQQAKEFKLTVSADKVERAVEEVKKQNNLNDAQFAEALRGQGLSLEGYRKSLKKQMLKLEVINMAVRSRIQVSDDEVRAAYQKSDRQYAGDRMAHLREIVLKTPKDATSEELDRKHALAVRLVSEARSGKSFTELAKAYSEADSRPEGGDLGYVQTAGLVDVLAEVVRQMDPGDIRGPIRTDAGYTVLELVEWKAGNLRPYEEVKEQLRRQLYDQEVEKSTASWVKELRAKAHLEIRDQH